MWELRTDAQAAGAPGAEAVAALELAADAFFSPTQLLEEEGDPMPANAVTPGADVACNTTAWTRLDPVPRPNRTRIHVLNPNGAGVSDPAPYRVGICFTASDAAPAANTPPDAVIESDYGVLHPSLATLTENVRCWGKSLGAASLTVRVSQFGS